MRPFQQRLPTMTTNVSHLLPLGVLLMLVMAAVPAPAQAQIGIGAGFNYDELEDVRTSTANATFEDATGYHVGVFYDLSLGPLALRPGVFYRRIGAYAFEVPSGDLSDHIEEFDINLVEIPIDVRFRLMAVPLLKPYVLAGPVITIPQAEGELSDGVEEAHMTADIGAGVEVQLPGLGFTLMPELRYGIGATRFFQDEFEIGDATITPQEDPRLNSVMLRLNVRF